jgi:hypothetical protein
MFWQLKQRKIATKAQRLQGFYFVILSWCLGAFVAKIKKFCEPNEKII